MTHTTTDGDTMPPKSSETRGVAAFEQAIREAGEWAARLDNLARVARGETETDT